MLLLLLKIVISTVIGLITGVLLLIVSLMILPTKWIVWILKNFKRDVLKRVFIKNDKYFNDVVSIILEDSHPSDYSDDTIAENKLTKIKELKADLDKIESNMFTIDLLKDLFATIQFASIQSDFFPMGETFEQIANYFCNYSSRLYDTSYRHNFSEDVLAKFNKVTDGFYEIEELMNADDSLSKNPQPLIKMETISFTDFIEQEKKELLRTRSSVRGSMKAIIYELMELAK